jgi:hypothetical protein
VIRNKRHIAFVVGLWLLATVWPIVSIPLHFKLVEHHACQWHAKTEGVSLHSHYSKCPVCDFQFFWKITPQEQLILSRVDILMWAENEHPQPFYHETWRAEQLLRGPPASA